jgi:RimJ/RimL family protein N-acetyltransferase
MSTNAPIEIRRLGPDDASELVALRRESLESHPLAFAASPSDDRLRTVELARELLADGRRSAVLGAFEASRLVGMAGVVHGRSLKRHHTAVVWGMYVAPRARNRGAGARLLQAVIAEARSWTEVERLELSVTDPAAGARRLYESAGFREWGRQPRALHWDGRFEDEAHLFLALR